MPQRSLRSECRRDQRESPCHQPGRCGGNGSVAVEMEVATNVGLLGSAGTKQQTNAGRNNQIFINQMSLVNASDVFILASSERDL